MDAVSEDKKIDEMASRLLAAFQIGDASEVNQCLSKSALSAPDLQEGFDYACSVLNGDETDIEVLPKMEEYIVEKGKSSRYKLARYKIHGEQNDYYLEFEFYIKDEFNESKIGIHQVYFDLEESYLAELGAYREAMAQADADDRSLPEWYYGATYERPGIYHPGWKEEAWKREGDTVG